METAEINVQEYIKIAGNIMLSLVNTKLPKTLKEIRDALEDELPKAKWDLVLDEQPIMAIIDHLEWGQYEKILVPEPDAQQPIIGCEGDESTEKYFASLIIKGTILLQDGEYEVFMGIATIQRPIWSPTWTLNEFIYRPLTKPLEVYLEEIGLLAA